MKKYHKTFFKYIVNFTPPQYLDTIRRVKLIIKRSALIVYNQFHFISFTLGLYP